MRREVMVARLLPDGRAEVVMDRPSACGGSCAACGGCEARQAAATAENPISMSSETWECRRSWIRMRFTPATFDPLSISRCR